MLAYSIWQNECLEILPNCPCCIKLSFFLTVANVLAYRHGRWQEYLCLTFAWMVSSYQLSRLKWSLKFTAQKLIPKQIWSYDLSVSFVSGRPITQRLFLFGLSYQVILHSCVLYLTYVTLNDEMKHVRGNGYGLF
jgi:hypothetical protein